MHRASFLSMVASAMLFGSDNWAGASPEVSEALAAVGGGFAAAYGADDVTKQARDLLSEFFDRDVEVFFTATGAAANMLALGAVARPGGVVLAHKDAHILVDEGAGPESLVGMRLRGLEGHQGRIRAREVVEALAEYPPEATYLGRVIAISLTQGTELGTTYCVMDIASIGTIARRNGIALHMDGARFANAVVAQGVSPKALSHEAGVDLLSLGFTKNGAWASEMVVSFNSAFNEDLRYRHKQMGQVFSKNRFAAAQAVAMLTDDHWRSLATHANAMAKRLSESLSELPGCRLVAPTEINEVFAVVPAALAESLQAKGAVFAKWPARTLSPEDAPGKDEVLIRLVASFATTDAHVDQFLDAAMSGQKAA